MGGVEATGVMLSPIAAGGPRRWHWPNSTTGPRAIWRLHSGSRMTAFEPEFEIGVPSDAFASSRSRGGQAARATEARFYCWSLARGRPRGKASLSSTR